MQDDTLGISEWGFKPIAVIEFVIHSTNLVNLQYGNEKCVKMHIGKTQEKDICRDLSVDAWKEDVIENKNGSKELKDRYIGKHVMENGNTKHLGDLLSYDGKNYSNIKERTNKAYGNIEKIIFTLTERPYGSHKFRVYRIMRDGHLLGGLLANAKSWINLNIQNDEAHERPDTQLLRKLFSTSGNPCKSFMMLEVGIIPVRFVIMQKQLLFLQYILKQSMDTMIKKSV